MLKFFILSFIILAHPLHVSLLSVEYSEKSDSFNVFLKIYADDFLLDYRLLTGDDSTRFDFIAKKETAEPLLRKYLNEKVQIFAEGKKLDGKLLTLESSDGELKMNLVFNNNKKSKNYRIKNLIMTDLYKDQSNLLIFRYGDYEEGIKLTAEKQEQNFIVK
jgi:hypothetical protein